MIKPSISLHRFSLAAKFGAGEEVTQPEAQYVQSAERLCCGLPVDMLICFLGLPDRAPHPPLKTLSPYGRTYSVAVHGSSPALNNNQCKYFHPLSQSTHREVFLTLPIPQSKKQCPDFSSSNLSCSAWSWNFSIPLADPVGACQDFITSLTWHGYLTGLHALLQPCQQTDSPSYITFTWPHYAAINWLDQVILRSLVTPTYFSGLQLAKQPQEPTDLKSFQL